MSAPIAVAILVTVAVLVGVPTIWFPRKVHEVVLSHQERTGLIRLNPFATFMRSPRYVVMLRLIGVLVVVILLCASALILRGPRPLR